VDRYDIPFMQRALDLARKGTGLASPNPMVGAIVVGNGEVLGEGFHRYESRDHAEIVALKSAGERARGATLYGSLEPCCHAGRTGPCTDAIVAAGIARVVAAMKDPNPKVAGRGIERLRAAGIEAETGVLEEEARRVNEAFAFWIHAGKPFVTLKSALTLDGQLALPGSRKPSGNQDDAWWITSPESRAEVQRMRHASDALLTGIGTILADDPLLTDRSGLPRRRRLLRVILDSGLRLSPRSRVVETAADDLLVFTLASTKSVKARQLERAGVQIVKATGERGRIHLRGVLKELGKRDILSVLLEAGSELNGAALAAGVVQKLFLFYAPKVAGEDGVPFTRARKLVLPPLENVQFHRFGPDFAVEGYLHDVYRNH